MARRNQKSLCSTKGGITGSTRWATSRTLGPLESMNCRRKSTGVCRRPLRPYLALDGLVQIRPKDVELGFTHGVSRVRALGSVSQPPFFAFCLGAPWIFYISLIPSSRDNRELGR
jgi:hypothetical protein